MRARKQGLQVRRDSVDEHSNGGRGTMDIKSSIADDPDKAKDITTAVVEAAPDKLGEIAAAIAQAIPEHRIKELAVAIARAAPDDQLKSIAEGVVEAAPDDKVRDIAAGIVQGTSNDKVGDLTAAIVEAAPHDQVKNLAATVIEAAPKGVKHDVATEMLRALPPVEELADYQFVAARPEDVQLIARAQVTKLEDYYNTALMQAKQSFKWALVAAGVGSAFFLFAVAVLLTVQSTAVATISIISGALIQVISGLNFYLYNKTTNQLVDFSARLDQTQRFLLANSICESLDTSKEKTRAALVTTIATLLPGSLDQTE